MDDVEDLTSAKMDYEYESIALPEVVAQAVAAARRAAPVGGGPMPLDEAEARWREILLYSSLADLLDGGPEPR